LKRIELAPRAKSKVKAKIAGNEKKTMMDAVD
jgi:hypothetical protein